MLLNGGVILVVAGVPSDVWPLTLLGATAVGFAVLWHGWSILRQLRAALPARFAPSVRYYVAAAPRSRAASATRGTPAWSSHMPR